MFSQARVFFVVKKTKNFFILGFGFRKKITIRVQVLLGWKGFLLLGIYQMIGDVDLDVNIILGIVKCI